MCDGDRSEFAFSFPRDMVMPFTEAACQTGPYYVWENVEISGITVTGWA
jgi:hypothetical protein